MRKPLKPKAAFSEAERARVTAACERLIYDFLKPRFLPSIQPTEFNYPVDILGKWHGAKYRLVQRYRSGFPDNLGEEFDAPFARLDWISPDRFDIQWHRHTGEWFRLYRGLTLDKAIETLSPTESCIPYTPFGLRNSLVTPSCEPILLSKLGKPDNLTAPLTWRVSSEPYVKIERQNQFIP